MTEFLRPAQAVIYTYDMEPITVISMRSSWWDHLIKYGQIRFAVYESMTVENLAVDDYAVLKKNYLTAEIRAHMIRRADNQVHLLLTTDHETTALLLDSSILPGQVAKINEMKKAAFGKGLIAALSSLG